MDGNHPQHTVDGRNPAPVGIWFIPLSPHYLQCFIVTYRLPTGAGFLPSTVLLGSKIPLSSTKHHFSIITITSHMLNGQK